MELLRFYLKFTMEELVPFEEKMIRIEKEGLFFFFNKALQEGKVTH